MVPMVLFIMYMIYIHNSFNPDRDKLLDLCLYKSPSSTCIHIYMGFGMVIIIGPFIHKWCQEYDCHKPLTIAKSSYVDLLVLNYIKFYQF